MNRVVPSTTGIEARIEIALLTVGRLSEVSLVSSSAEVVVINAILLAKNYKSDRYAVTVEQQVAPVQVPSFCKLAHPATTPLILAKANVIVSIVITF